ncbi:TRAP transporter small permease [Kerstersia sp.]|uniref:TRAP transporter small permease n=1 Tax=Kerstersia sp. TaxID=1930783 RepID=UPI003F8FA2A5
MNRPPSLPVRLVAGLTTALNAIAAILLTAMMLLTVIDVGGRYFFNRPVLGSFEITEIMLAGLVFCTLPLVTLAHEHISVDLFENALPARLRRLRNALVQCLCAVAMLFVAWRLVPKAMDASAYGDTTASLLIPMAPLIWLMCAMAALTGLVFLGQAGCSLFAAPASGSGTPLSQAEQQ